MRFLMMKLFPNIVASWREPEEFTYSTNRFPVLSLFAVITIMLLMARSRHFPVWVPIAITVFALLLSAMPWIHHRWPWLFRMTGPLVSLCEDRFVRQSGKSQVYIALKDIAECAVSRDVKGNYSIISFKRKNTSAVWLYLFGDLSATAISDSQIEAQVLAYVREKGIAITKS